MTLYIVSCADYDSYGILGIYTTLEQAELIYEEASVRARANHVAFEAHKAARKVGEDTSQIEIPYAPSYNAPWILLEELEADLPLRERFSPDPQVTRKRYDASLGRET